jgi:hopene-associated glycosyltransferase HpnB
MAALALLAGLVAVSQLVLLLAPRRRWPGEWRVPTVAPSTRPDRGDAVVAIVPARNEAAVLPATLPSLLDQLGGTLRVVLVDDKSTDGTAAVARRVAEEHGATERLTVLAAPPCPEGWTGKLHALDWGVRHAPPESAESAESAESGSTGAASWWLFTDADIAHRPGALAGLLAVAVGALDGAGGRDLVSVMARLRAESFWERLLIPPFVFFFQVLYPFRQVSRPPSDGASVAAAAGGCVLLRRESLAAIGGLAALRGAVIDDVTLARRVRDAGGRLWLGLDPGITSVRRYGLADLWGMVARTAFTQLRHRWSLVLLVMLGLGVAYGVPLLATGLGLATATPLLTLTGLFAWTAAAMPCAPVVRYHRVPAWFALTLPFAAFLYGLMTLTSAIQHARGRGARWKGRSYE